MSYFIITMSVMVFAIALDCLCFALTPYEQRPKAWWRYAPLSGFIMYWRWILSRG